MSEKYVGDPVEELERRLKSRVDHIEFLEKMISDGDKQYFDLEQERDALRVDIQTRTQLICDLLDYLEETHGDCISNIKTVNPKLATRVWAVLDD